MGSGFETGPEGNESGGGDSAGEIRVIVWPEHELRPPIGTDIINVESNVTRDDDLGADGIRAYRGYVVAWRAGEQVMCGPVGGDGVKNVNRKGVHSMNIGHLVDDKGLGAGGPRDGEFSGTSGTLGMQGGGGPFAGAGVVDV